MTSIRPDDLRLYELFVRYWDNTLSHEEAAEFEERLTADEQARDRFHQFMLQTVAAADLPAMTPAPESPRDRAPDPLPNEMETTNPVRHPQMTRRRMMHYVSGGLAAGLGGAALGWWLWPEEPDRRARLFAARGTVTVRTPEGDSIPNDGHLPTSAVVATHGFGSSVVIAYPDGSTVSLVGDSVVAASDGGMQLQLRQGAASANVRVRAEGTPVLSLVTAQVLLPAISGALITLGQAARKTDLEVHQGWVSASAPSGEQLAVVRAGEMLTVQADGDLRKQKTPATPEEFGWDLTRPLPDGWAVGVREDPLAGPPVVRPEHWPDPYYGGTRMYQIRSDHQWMRGFFRLEPDSRILVKYRAKSSGRGQVCFCVRTDQSRCSDTGMLEYNGGFQATGGEWRCLDIRAEKMLELPNVEGPKFGSPWIGFLVIFNTYEANLGMEVAEFRVTRPGGRNPAE